MTVGRFILCISVFVLITGCKTSFQSNWKNFNAYYNTYYNAKKNYKTGLQKNLNQNREYNPLQPIRIHPKPVNAGAGDFDKAIQKGADVLRRYEDTKWVDDAIGLIGKSYYFRQEYFSADQKFKELFVTTESKELQQNSIMWQGRVLLDMELHNEGIAFLSEQLTLLEGEWIKKYRAEVLAILAQHHVEMENWQVAANTLSEALPEIPRKEYRERGYFLLGQIYERLGNTEEAFKAYNQVQNHYVEYRIQYLAQRKRAEVARNLGRNDVAFNIFNDMVRDDKNLEYKAELDFELARTEHERGNYKRAEKLYNNVLHKNLREPSAEIAARSYNGLAEIYRFEYDNFEKAAAYYDSAAQKNVPAEKLPEEFNAQILSESFGNYARIKSQIALQDSLIKLGKLSPAEFDSVLTELRAKKLAELEKMREEQRQQQNQLVNVNRDPQESDATNNMSNGFLNSNNPVVQQDVKQQFFAIWGDRPLADNWRVRSMIDYSAVNTVNAESEQGNSGSQGSQLGSIQIDISPIPFTKTEQDSVQKLIASYEYQLGNLFFLSLNLPDSASHYFQKAIDNPSEENVNTVSLYSLSELYSIEGDQEEARKYAQRLIDEYPRTEYARRVAEKYDLNLRVEEEEGGEDPLDTYNQIVEMDSLSSSQLAERLSSFALDNQQHKIAAKAQYESIQSYMTAGKEEPLYKEKIADWVDVNENWDEKVNSFEAKKDSARAALKDSTITEEQRMGFQAMADSTLEKPDFENVFPYQGAMWDSARAGVNIFQEMFSNSSYTSRVNRINAEISLPEEEKTLSPEEQPDIVAEEGVKEGYLGCNEINADLSVRGGMQAFMEQIEVGNGVDLEEIRYLFRVNQRGIVDEFELLTEEAPGNLVENINQAIEGNLNFEPVLNEGQAVKVECELSFPLTN